MNFVNSIGSEFVYIEGAVFYQGAIDSDRLARFNEYPRHRIEVKSFYISKYLVTQEDYYRIMGINPSFFSKTGKGAERVDGIDTRCFPVDSVSWEDAISFCQRLSSMPEERLNRRFYRLPKESEWEYACRGNNETVFGNGNVFTSDDANINGNYPYNSNHIGKTLNRPTVVGSYLPNSFGLYDMHGNVWEWCQDIYTPYDQHNLRYRNARVLRGGAWNCYSRYCRSSYRCIGEKNTHYYDNGFRLICEII